MRSRMPEAIEAMPNTVRPILMIDLLRHFRVAIGSKHSRNGQGNVQELSRTNVSIATGSITCAGLECLEERLGVFSFVDSPAPCDSAEASLQRRAIQLIVTS